MVRADTLDVIDRILKIFRRKPYLPFGGVQVILIGDTFQLPPIARRQEWAIPSQFYKTPFFFSSKIIEQNKPLYIELKKIYRQKEQEFIDLLNRVRVNQLNQNDFNELNSKYNPTFSGEDKDYIILATHNDIVNDINLKKLNQLETNLFTFEAKVTDIFPDQNKPTDHYLQLKVEAQIMFIKNCKINSKRIFNGKIGKIRRLEENSITVAFEDESEVEVERVVWNNIQYTYNSEKKKVEEEIIGTFEQFPIRLAWAITVHKSQGLTFDKVIADLGQAFASGQVYVALSRCTSFSGLVLKSRIVRNCIKTDNDVIEFAKHETPETLVVDELNKGKADYYYRQCRKSIEEQKFEVAFDLFIKAIKFRNDLETNSTKRFTNYFLSKLSLYKSFVNNGIAESEVLAQTQQETEAKLNLISIELKQKQDDYSKLLNQNKSSESKVEDLTLQTKHLQEQNTVLQNESLALNKELRRVKSITWHQKLFGDK